MQKNNIFLLQVTKIIGTGLDTTRLSGSLICKTSFSTSRSLLIEEEDQEEVEKQEDIRVSDNYIANKVLSEKRVSGYYKEAQNIDSTRTVYVARETQEHSSDDDNIKDLKKKIININKELSKNLIDCKKKSINSDMNYRSNKLLDNIRPDIEECVQNNTPLPENIKKQIEKITEDTGINPNDTPEEILREINLNKESSPQISEDLAKSISTGFLEDLDKWRQLSSMLKELDYKKKTSESKKKPDYNDKDDDDNDEGDESSGPSGINSGYSGGEASSSGAEPSSGKNFFILVFSTIASLISEFFENIDFSLISNVFNLFF